MAEETTSTGRALRRRAVIVLDADNIARMLNLPAGCAVIGVNADWERTALRVMVQHDALPSVDPGAEPLFLAGAWEWDGETQRLRFVAEGLPAAADSGGAAA